jgi:hypothetical protein
MGTTWSTNAASWPGRMFGMMVNRVEVQVPALGIQRSSFRLHDHEPERAASG